MNTDIKEETDNKVLSREAIMSTMGRYVDMADERLNKLGEDITKEDVYDAMYERGERNEPLLSVTFSVDHYDRKTLEHIKSVTKFVTTGASADFFDVDGYGTLILDFDKANEAMSLLQLLDQYGHELTRGEKNSEEILSGTVTAVPFLLGGKYALVAANPRQWVPLSQSNDAGCVDEIRIYFGPDEHSVIKLEEPVARESVKEIQSELVQQEWELEQRTIKETERKAYEAEREAAREEARNAKHKHTFSV